MKELNFRYVVKNKHTGRVYFKYYTLNQIEISGLSGLFDIENYEIISRDRFVELQDKNGVDICEGDILTLKGYDSSFLVEYNIQNSGFFINPIDSDILDIFNYQKLGNGYLKRIDLTVTGNIHENN